MQRHRTNKSLLALIGARLAPDWFAYVDHIGILLLYLLICILVVLLIIQEAITCLIVVQHPINEILALLRREWQTFLEVIIFTFGASILLYREMKRAVKQMRGLIAVTRADPDQPPQVALSDYVEVSMPAWLQRLPQVDLSDEMLDTLQQRIDPEEPWMKNLAAYLRKNAPEYSPSVSILVSVGERVSISVLGPNDRSKLITITQTETAAIVGFLALQEKGIWVRRKDIVQRIYGENEQNLNTHIKRLNDKVNEAVQRMMEQSGKGESDQLPNAEENKLKLIEYNEIGKEHFWRLLLTCEIEIFPGLVSLYEQITVAQENPNVPPPNPATLYQDCRSMVEHYGKGLFASYQKKRLGQYQYWPWATEYYTKYQDKCLAVLSYTAKREWADAMHHKKEPDILHTSIRQTAQIYTWKLQAALGVIPHLPHAEQAICMCLKLYRIIGDITTAVQVFQTYATFMKEQKDGWKPSARITECWPEAALPPESGPESSSSE